MLLVPHQNPHSQLPGLLAARGLRAASFSREPPPFIGCCLPGNYLGTCPFPLRTALSERQLSDPKEWLPCFSGAMKSPELPVRWGGRWASAEPTSLSGFSSQSSLCPSPALRLKLSSPFTVPTEQQSLTSRSTKPNHGNYDLTELRAVSMLKEYLNKKQRQ